MNYTSIQDIDSLSKWVKAAIKIKSNPLKIKKLGKNKTLGMLFFNPSLRTRLSTQKAALNLGMNVMVMNFTNEGWTLEFEDGAIMNQGASEHIKEAAEVVSQYCDIIAIRAFGLVDKEKTMPKPLWQDFKICYRSCCKYGRGHRSPTTITCRRDYHGRVQNGS
jgi:N-succinyl-L-ornithine transcarbamylase